MSNVSPVPAVKEKSIVLVPTEYCPLEWGRVQGLLEPAVKRSGGRWTMASLLRSLCLGEQNLWVALDERGAVMSALTTQVVYYPGCKMLAFQFLGGKGFDDWSGEMLDRMEDYAKDSGCTGMEAVGRFGFWPFFKQHGFERAYCTYQRVFSEDS